MYARYPYLRTFESMAHVTHVISSWVYSLPSPARARARGMLVACEADVPALINLGDDDEGEGGEGMNSSSYANSAFALPIRTALDVVLDVDSVTRVVRATLAPSSTSVIDEDDISGSTRAPPLPGALPLVYWVDVVVLLGEGSNVTKPDGTKIDSKTGVKSSSEHASTSHSVYLPREMSVLVTTSEARISLPGIPFDVTRDGGDPLMEDVCLVRTGIRAAARAGIDLSRARRWVRLLAIHSIKADGLDGGEREHVAITLLCLDAASTAARVWHTDGLANGAWDDAPVKPIVSANVSGGIPKKRARPEGVPVPEPPLTPCLLVVPPPLSLATAQKGGVSRKPVVSAVSLESLHTSAAVFGGSSSGGSISSAVVTLGTALAVEALSEILLRDAASQISRLCSANAAVAAEVTQRRDVLLLERDGLDAFRLIDIEGSGAVSVRQVITLLQCGGGRLSRANADTLVASVCNGGGGGGGGGGGDSRPILYQDIVKNYYALGGVNR